MEDDEGQSGAMRATPDEYTDLPDWIRPGAKLAAVSYRDSYTLVTVVRITRTQIIAEPSSGRYTLRFNREGRRSGWGDGGTVEYRLRGAHSGTRLVERSHPDVTQLRLGDAARSAIREVERSVTAYHRPDKDDKRHRDVRTLAMLDDIENATRAARREILALLAQAEQTSP